jgi:two-component system cell cycle response regulator
LDEARLNERKLQRLGQLEQRLIATNSLVELIQTILEDYKSSYEIDTVTLVLIDPEYEITRILEREKLSSPKMPGLVLLEKLRTDNEHPRLGAFNADLPDAIFDPWPDGCRSMALLPLIRRDRLIGSLNLASCDANRFTPDSRADFLERLASILSICIENALNLERLKLAGLTDVLTGVNNRRYFEFRCQEEVAQARRQQQPLACMFLDIDKFKRINDELGHQAGDEILRGVAALIKSQLRTNDVFARYGGEEFVALLPQVSLTRAQEIAERIRARMEAHAFELPQGANLAITISIGVAMLPETVAPPHAEAARMLIESADGALYRAKGSGRNKVVCAPISG